MYTPPYRLPVLVVAVLVVEVLVQSIIILNLHRLPIRSPTLVVVTSLTTIITMAVSEANRVRIITTNTTTITIIDPPGSRSTSDPHRKLCSDPVASRSASLLLLHWWPPPPPLRLLHSLLPRQEPYLPVTVVEPIRSNWPTRA